MASSEPRPPLTGRELILASAGSGKTHRLSSRLIALLAAEVPPETILASTFTRKAAGEIVNRVLLRLAAGALEADAALRLAAEMPSELDAERLTVEGWGELLIRSVRGIHRFQVETLDAFFHRVARAFPEELGLPEGWTIAPEPEVLRLRARALEEALEGMDQGTLVELVRMAARGGADREVHRLLTEGVRSLHRLYRELDPEVEDPWGFPGGSEAFGAVDPKVVEDAIARLEELELPRRKKDGEVDATWSKARTKAVEALRSGDWGAFYKDGLGAALLGGGGKYNRHPLPASLLALELPLRATARAAVGPRLHRQVAAFGRFLPEYDARLRRLQRAEGIYGFDDLTDALVAGEGLGRREELYYRLDGRIRHILLDEFQDTSNAQWAALEPLVGEILAGSEEGRLAFLVADPKQSIYGWRGGEPRILDRISERYGLPPAAMAVNWRSSQIVLDQVNEIFRDLSANPVIADNREIAARWSTAFEPHHAHHDLPGYLRIVTGSDPSGGSGVPKGGRPLESAVFEVERVHRAAPGATIGILTMTNRTAAHLIALLRARGLEASEEGGVPIADSEPVLALLALLRMADHPGDKRSRYIVARTPIGALVGLAPDGWTDDRASEEVGRNVRARLLREGYGEVLSEWARALEPGLLPRDRARMRRLVELAFAWEPRATLRPSDFVRLVEAARAEDPATAAIRVMTVYRAKGLEFDAVFLPELDGLSLTGEVDAAFLPDRPGGIGAVRRIFPAVAKELRPLFPEVDEARAQAREREVRDGLSALYVAVTRARFGLYLFLKPDPKGNSEARTAARLVREAFVPGGAAPADAVLREVGDPAWWHDPRVEARRFDRPVAVPAGRWGIGEVRLRPAPRVRLLPREAPSDLEGGERVSLAAFLRPRGEATHVGTAVHAWLEAIEWVESGIPDDDALLRIAAERAPRLSDARTLLEDFRGWLAEGTGLQALLSRAGYPPGTTVERELPLLAREGGRLIQGSIDRVHRIPSAGGDHWEVIDWKSDALDGSDPAALQSRVAYYRPQVEAYLRGLAAAEGAAADRVAGRIHFLRPGITVEVKLP